MSGVRERASGLTWREFTGISRAAVALCRVALGLRRHNFTDLLGRLQLNQKLPAASAELVEQEARRVRRAHRLVPLETNCLLDSVATAMLVRRHGYSVALVIGVQKNGSTLQAHAWLGTPSPQDARNFTPLLRVPIEE
jgi:hypothetical protein